MITSCPFKTVVTGNPLSWRVQRIRAARKVRSAAMIALWMMAALGPAQNRTSEYAVKSAYLFNFGKFVRFTSSDAANNRQTFDICIVGDDPLGHTLDDLTANERLDGKLARVARVKTAAEARACAIAYVSAAEGTRVGADLDTLRGEPVLTVSDSPNFLKRGGMIQFVNVGNHVRFAVNLEAVRNAQLNLSSELLRVAVTVSGETPGGTRP